MTHIAARPFDWPYDGRLDPVATALLVIDMQDGFLSDRGYFARMGYDPTPLRTILPVVARLADGARQAGCTVVWTRQGYRADAADASPYDRWRALRSGVDLTVPGEAALSRGSQGHAIVRDLSPDPRDVIVDKTANGAFYQTDLELILRARRITHLILCGVTTDVCVHTTLREAVDRKYQCLLVEDACASGDAFAHRAGIHMVTVEDGVFGVVADADAVLAGLAGTSSEDPRP